MTSPTNHASEATKAAFEFERNLQDLADAEWSDSGRDLERWPRGWWLYLLAGATLTIALGLAAGWWLYQWLYPWH